jgi:hypothetical protein
MCIGASTAIEAEFSFTGQMDYQQDTTGSVRRCPDTDAPTKFDDHVRVHLAWDTVWRVVIPVKPGRVERVFKSDQQKLHGSNWSIKGNALGDGECDPPVPYDCAGSFKPAAKAPIVFAPEGDERWLATMVGPVGIAATPGPCSYAGVHRSILGEIPGRVFDKLGGAISFHPEHLLKIKESTKTGDLKLRVKKDCGSDDTTTCSQSADGAGSIRYERLGIRYKKG